MQFVTMRSKRTLTVLCAHCPAWLNSHRLQQQSIGSWPNTCNVYVVLCCILMRHTELQRADRGSTGTQSQALRQKHYRSEVKYSSTSLWGLNSEPSGNTPVATERKYYMLPVKALFYCFWPDKLHIFHVVCGHVISVWELLLSQFSLP